MCKQIGAETEETHKKSARVANNDILHATYHRKLQLTVLVKIKKKSDYHNSWFPWLPLYCCNKQAPCVICVYANGNDVTSGRVGVSYSHLELRLVMSI
jgi:hypothetical protein